MIRYLTRSELDVSMYDDCISKSINSRVYGYSWYLDAVCNTWDVLVLDDYIAVMPLPKRKKHGLSYVYLATWIQQLGVFTTETINKPLVEKFIDKIPKKFKLVDLMLNTECTFSSKYITPKTNFILQLNNVDYQSLTRAFSKGRKSSIKQAQRLGLTIQTTDTADSIIQLFKENKGTQLKKAEQDYSALQNLVKKGRTLDKLIVYEVLDSNKQLLGGAIILKDKYRITYLFSALSTIGREKQAMSFLVDFILQKYADQPLVLDFEGSMIPEIASFYKSFGAEIETYYHYKKYRL